MNRRTLLGASAAIATSLSLPLTAQTLLNNEVFDLVVAGSGLAGHAAAVSAREAGLHNVVILEKGPVIGGHTALSSGSLAVYSPKRIQAQGIKDSIDDWVRDARGIGGTINEALIRRIAQNSESAAAWLESMGVQFSRFLFQPLGGIGARCIAPTDERGGSSYIKMLHQKTQALDIDTRLMCALVDAKWLHDSNLWLLTISNQGEETELLSRGLVITTGGFTGNSAMLRIYAPHFSEDMRNSANPEGLLWDGATGDGIKLAQRLGAQTVDMQNVTYLPYWGGRVLDYAGAEIFVNLEGKRFVDETASVGQIVASMLLEPEQAMWVITDSKSKKGANLGTKLASGKVHTSQSIEDMAQQMFIPVKVLKQTIDEYNLYAKSGQDPVFGKTLFTQTIDTPPFYWGREQLYVHCTLGGIKTNAFAQVLDQTGRPFEHLWAAGETVGGIFGNDRLGGMSLANALVMGRIAGKNAAQSILKLTAQQKN